METKFDIGDKVYCVDADVKFVFDPGTMMDDCRGLRSSLYANQGIVIEVRSKGDGVSYLIDTSNKATAEDAVFATPEEANACIAHSFDAARFKETEQENK